MTRPRQKKLLIQTEKKPTSDRFFRLGTVLRVHGLKGTLVIHSDCRLPGDIFRYDSWWLGTSPENLQQFPFVRGWTHGKRLFARLKGVDDCNCAGELKGESIWVHGLVVDPVADGEYFWADLIGYEVWDIEKRELLGSVTGLQDFGAEDILCVHTADGAEVSGEWLLPFIKDVIVEVNENAHSIDVRLPEGMEACFTPKS